MNPIWLLLADDWIFAVGGLIFCLMGALLVKSLPQPRSGFIGILLSPLNTLTTAGTKAVLKIVHNFAPAAFKPQQAVGAGLHEAARIVDDTASVIDTESAIVAQLAQALAGTATAADLAIERAKLGKRIADAQTAAKGIGADVQPRIEAATQGIEANVNRRLRTLDREIAELEEAERVRVGGRVQPVDRALTDLWAWVHKHTLVVGTTAFAGAVAWALSRIGASWIRCNPFRQNAKRLCGLDASWLDALLDGALAVVGTLSLVALANELLGLADTFVPVVTGTFRELKDVPRRTAAEQGFE